MKYKIQYALSIETEDSFDEFLVTGAECVPRIGEHVEINGKGYQVQIVFHFTDGSVPVVRVK